MRKQTLLRAAAPAAPSVRAARPAVVGIGASAGGLKALQRLVAAVPADSGMAYVVILHLDPDRASRMSELLQDRSAIPVSQVTGTTRVEANHIYIIPPEQDLALVGRTLELRDRGERAEHAPVDLFFRTLAESCGEDAVGVVLSGTGADGTAGIRYIREAGGVTVAQSPEEAEFDGMPVSAIATGLIDRVLPASDIPAEVMRLRRRPASPDGDDGVTAEAALSRVLSTLRSRTGHDFSQYKRATVLRRLERRLRFTEVATLEDYVPLLESRPEESQVLLRDLLISVSAFFRDPEAFEALSAQMPGLFEGKGSADTVRVWVVGCATGEEVYSIAIVLADHAATLDEPPRIQLFATDIDEHGYASGRAGLYTAAAVANVSPDRLQRYFTKEPSGYRVSKPLREMVLFAGHNVLHDPPFSRMDMISCRNLLIYLEPEAQARVLETFHFALNPSGLLLLGAAESIGDSGLFEAIDAAHRLYRRGIAHHRVAPRLSAADPRAVAGSARIAGDGAAAESRNQPTSHGAVHVRMLELYAPASVIVDERLDVVHMSAGAGRVLRLGEGRPSHRLLDLAQPELRRVLRTTLHHAFRDGTTTTRRISMQLDGGTHQVTVQVRPSEQTAEGRFALVVFEVEDPQAVPAQAQVEREDSGPRASEVELEEELQRTRDLLDSTVAAHDRTVAELQTVNEELLSINEEQKAASEELETNREEIQSINEELTTINQEHQSTIEELKRTNADLQNLIESTEIGTIFLDRAMRIRRFTPATLTIFNFVDTDQGRPFADITHRLKYAELWADVASAVASLQRVEREVESDTGRWYIVRISPYRSHDGSSDGVVLTFFDNTAQHLVRDELREAKLIAESANGAKGAFLATLSHEFRTPLSAILGYADLLTMNGTLADSQAQWVNRIRVGGWHLVSMIDEILSFVRLDGGQEVVDAKALDAREIAREAADLIEPLARAKELALAVDLPAEPVDLFTDGDKTRQILVNLCGNAVKYTETGEIRLRVLADAEHVTFEVRDTGIGIAPEHQAQIFERFWQVDGSAVRVRGGMGIGLAVAREYARLLGGDVEVESAPGRGSTFRLRLPHVPEQN